MRKEMLFSVLALAMFGALISMANAQITASITVKDSKGNVISGNTVPIGTTAHVNGTYVDKGGNSATGLMEVCFNDTSGLKYRAEIWSGTVNSGGTIEVTYPLTELGYYEFIWTCQRIGPALRCEERTQIRTTIQLVVPEPGTLAGLAMALAAFGLLAIKRTRAK